MPIPFVQQVVAQVIIDGSQSALGSSASPAGNVFYYRRTTVPGNMDKSALATQFLASIVAPLLAAANLRYTPRNLLVRCVDDAEDPVLVVPAAGAGATATDPLPSSAIVNVRLQSVLRGKSFRGKKKFAGANESDTTGDVLTGAGLVLWQAVRNACSVSFVDGAGITWVPVILSKKLSQVKTNPTVVVYSDVSAAILDKNILNLRKRRAKTVV